MSKLYNAAMWHRLLGTYQQLRHTKERGLSQSTENAILLTGAVAIALAVIAAVTNYVSSKLGSLQ